MKVFLNGQDPEKKRTLEKFLPEQERLRLEKIPVAAGEIPPDGDLLEKVHWSWFLPTLKTYPEAEQKLFLSVLDSYAAKNLAKTLILSSSIAQEVPEMARAYLRKVLLDSLSNRLVPIGYLPQTPLNRLLSLSKKELTRLIDFLSLHDLAAELRQIVETKILKKIYSLLSEEERKFVKNAMAYKDHLVLARMGLDRWDGSEETLRTLLHRRGLARLGAALSGQDPDFVWYVCHQLDIGRGNALFKHCKNEKIHGVSDVVIRQVEELL